MWFHCCVGEGEGGLMSKPSVAFVILLREEIIKREKRKETKKIALISSRN